MQGYVAYRAFRVLRVLQSMRGPHLCQLLGVFSGLADDGADACMRVQEVHRGVSLRQKEGGMEPNMGPPSHTRGESLREKGQGR